MPRVSKKQIEEPTSVRSGTPAFVAILFFVGIFVTGGAIMIGRSDTGEIDVTSTINQANVTNAENGTGEHVNAGNPALQKLPNGGLVVAENQPPATTPVTETVTGTTTDTTSDSGTSTSTESDVPSGSEAVETTPQTGDTPPTETTPTQ